MRYLQNLLILSMIVIMGIFVWLPIFMISYSMHSIGRLGYNILDFIGIRL